MPSITYTLTNSGLNLLRDSMSGADNAKVVYVALGTSSTAPTVNDTKLGAEVWRKKIASFTNGASPGEILINGYIAPGDAVGVGIQEVGFIGGGNASGSPNTGVLLARGLYSHTKTNVESIQVQLDCTV